MNEKSEKQIIFVTLEFETCMSEFLWVLPPFMNW